MAAPEQMSVIKTRLAAIAKLVSGVKRTYAEAPQSLPESDLPIAIPFAGPVAAYDEVFETLGEETRTYLVRLYVKPIQAGYDGEAERAVEPFMSRFRDVFLAHPALGLGTSASLIPFIERTTWLGDNGIAVLPFGDTKFLGCEFRLNVKIAVPIAIANYE
jgi:hypothetical protein